MNPEPAAVLQRHLAAENAHNLEGTLATLHQDCLFEDYATGRSGAVAPVLPITTASGGAPSTSR